MAKRWTDAEKWILRNNRDMFVKDLMAKLPGRNMAAIHAQRSKLRVKRLPRAVAVEEDQVLPDRSKSRFAAVGKPHADRPLWEGYLAK